MNVQVSIESVKAVSQDIREVSRQLERMSREIDAVKRELRKQTEFDSEIRALKKAGNRIAEEENKAAGLAQALASIGNLYQSTETDVGERFERKK